MSDPLLQILNKVDTLKLKASIFGLSESVKNCSDDELHMLNKAGMLPIGCLMHIFGIRGSK